jgi:hypothetical protein
MVNVDKAVDTEHKVAFQKHSEDILEKKVHREPVVYRVYSIVHYYEYLLITF